MGQTNRDKPDDRIWERADILNYPLLKDFAHQNRLNPTLAEQVLWEHLRGKCGGYRFRRQHIIGNYIADFVCLSKQVIVELDGGYHFTPEQMAEDKVRTDCLKSMGFREIRFSNDEVLSNPELVIQKILDYINE